MKTYLPVTPSQTIGPFFAYGLVADDYAYGHSQVAGCVLKHTDEVKSDPISIQGRIVDGNGEPIPDALLEIWQPDSQGQFNSGTFNGFGRIGSGVNADGFFEFHTIKPGSVESGAPFILVTVFMRGLLTHAYTRIYFSDEQDANDKDPVLQGIDQQRRKTLVAQQVARESGEVVYRFDIHMQGENETVFFAPYKS